MLRNTGRTRGTLGEQGVHEAHADAEEGRGDGEKFPRANWWRQQWQQLLSEMLEAAPALGRGLD